MKIVLFIIIAISFSFIGCKKKKEAKSRIKLLTEVYDNVISVNNLDISEKSNQLKESVKTLVLNVNQDNLDKCKDSWRSLALSLTKSEAFNIGDLKSNLSYLFLAKYPVSQSKIIENYTSNNTSNGISSDAKGLHAIEYLLFNDNALDSLTQAQFYPAHLNFLTLNLNDNVASLLSSWHLNESFFKANTGEGSKNSFNQYVNGIIQFAENLKVKKVGKPIGKLTLGISDSTFTQATFSNYSKTLIEQDLNLLQSSWNGCVNSNLGILSIKDILPKKSDDLITKIDDSFLKCKEKLQAVSNNYNLATQNKDASVEALYIELETLYTYFKVDVVANLDVSLFVSDLDGD